MGRSYGFNRTLLFGIPNALIPSGTWGCGVNRMDVFGKPNSYVRIAAHGCVVSVTRMCSQLCKPTGHKHTRVLLNLQDYVPNITRVCGQSHTRVR